MTNQQIAKYLRIARKFGIKSPETMALEKASSGDPVFAKRIKNIKKLFK